MPHVLISADQHTPNNIQHCIRVKHWRRCAFTCRRINRRWQASAWTDGGTTLRPVVHWLTHYCAISVWGGVMSCHLTLDCFDKLLHLSWSVPKPSCTHTITVPYSCFLQDLSHAQCTFVAVSLSLHVLVCHLKRNSTFSKLLSPNRLFILCDHMIMMIIIFFACWCYIRQHHIVDCF